MSLGNACYFAPFFVTVLLDALKRKRRCPFFIFFNISNSPFFLIFQLPLRPKSQNTVLFVTQVFSLLVSMIYGIKKTPFGNRLPPVLQQKALWFCVPPFRMVCLYRSSYPLLKSSNVSIHHSQVNSKALFIIFIYRELVKAMMLKPPPRLGAQRLIQEFLEQEVTNFLGRDYYQRRNEENENNDSSSYYKERSIKTAEGRISVHRPQVKDSERTFCIPALAIFSMTCGSLSSFLAGFIFLHLRFYPFSSPFVFFPFSRVFQAILQADFPQR